MGIGDVGFLILVVLVAFFVVKTVIKVALRLFVLAVLAIAAILYFTGNLPFSF